MKYNLKYKVNVIVKSLIMLLMVVFLESQTNTVVLNSHNNNLNKTLDLKELAIVDTNDPQILAYQNINTQPEEVIQEENEEVSDPQILASYTGKLTGYVYNCPQCSGRLACDSSIKLNNGNIHYNDNTYGEVRIVASSKDLPCGSIVRFNAPSVSDEAITAIVLDRGVSGKKLDLLTESNEYARKHVGRQTIEYDVLRMGY